MVKVVIDIPSGLFIVINLFYDFVHFLLNIYSILSSGDQDIAGPKNTETAEKCQIINPVTGFLEDNSEDVEISNNVMVHAEVQCLSNSR